MSLRDYQQKALTEIRKEFSLGNKRVLLVMPTGAGKTATFCEMVKQAVARGLKAVIIVRGRKLVDQASKRLFRESVQHGVLMNRHWNYKPHLPVQVCSVDTLIARDLKPDADLLIVDEGHLFGEKSQAAELINNYTGFTVSVTATPYLPEGMSHLANAIVRPIKMMDLIEQGYLVDFRYYAPSEPDVTGVKISSTTKDYDSKQIEERMVAGQLTGKIIDNWKRVASDRPTILFAVNIHHSEMLTERFNAEGIPAEHCDANTSDEKREQVIRRLENGQTKVVCNVGIFCTGVDIPALGAIILARPTKSYNLFIQQCGRGTRTYPGKTNCILLDHAGNIGRHGFPTLEPDVDLEGKIKRSLSHVMESKVCKKCFAVYRGSECPECGTPPPKPKAEIAETDEILEEIEIKSRNPVEAWLQYLEQQRVKTGKKNGWQFHMLLKKFPLEQCRPYLPSWFVWRMEQKQNEDRGNPFSGAPFGFRK